MSDKITPEQLRKEVVAVERMHGEILTVEWRTKQVDQLRAHADALEELATLRKQLAERDAEIVALKGRLHEIAEEWAGAECGEPVTAQEGYAIGLCKRMYRLAAYPKE